MPAGCARDAVRDVRTKEIDNGQSAACQTHADAGAPQPQPSPRLGLGYVMAGRLVSRIKPHNKEVDGLCWSPDGSRLATASSDFTIKVTDVAAGLMRVEGSLRDTLQAVAEHFRGLS